MMSHSIATLLLTFLTIFPSGQNKPIRINDIHPYWVAPPQSLSAMITAADAVVRVKLLGAESAKASSDEIITTARFEVLDILDTLGGYNVDPTDILVQRRGGDIDHGTYIERQTLENFPAFEQGHDYVLFLTHQTDSPAWLVAFGPSGVFALTSGRVKSSEVSKVTRDQAEKDAGEFLQLIRNFGR